MKNREERKTLTIRLPIVLKETLEKESNSLGISLNSYILLLLQTKIKKNNI